jgi:His/Glu/Gln/Arg/opine family amino acid ABC transporter permease subunit
MYFNWRILEKTWDMYRDGLIVTIQYSVVAIIVAVLWGILIGSINFRQVRGLSLVTRAYTTFFRETPLLVQIYFWFYGLSRVMPVSAMAIGVMALVFNDGAFIAEIVRGGLQSINKGQEEAAYSLGFSKLQTLRYFLIPQALRKTQDSIMNMVSIIIKDTSLLMWITITELTYVAHRVNSKYYQPITAYLIAAALYFALFLIVQGIKKLMDKGAKRRDDVRPA